MYKKKAAHEFLYIIWQASERKMLNEKKNVTISTNNTFKRRSKWWQNQRFQLNCVSGRLFVRIWLIHAKFILLLLLGWCFFITCFIWTLSVYTHTHTIRCLISSQCIYTLYGMCAIIPCMDLQYNIHISINLISTVYILTRLCYLVKLRLNGLLYFPFFLRFRHSHCWLSMPQFLFSLQSFDV